MALVGPLASFSFGLLLAAIVYAFAPGINLLQRPWIAPVHLLRAMVWLNLLLGAINLLPAFPLDGSRVFRRAPVIGPPEDKGESTPAAPARNRLQD